ncbi:phospholipid-translocating P-type ATPase, flippase [Vittaforma corneae ATCC 50505]|uniref:Phospholipid-transporting ATPase n=1 Tax=Vittaforma corneae (strain ATCC 50505) TaxID=993615 RepID=L2GPR5_VITCO|nr:phospholipid-translocating P-type ATPase, flippase [Vittaforma corneae ATCC 50505]ELA42888.1 phospholipid-translocating P-type ATPase, flippase [Vittaforma corneae ATCC 50505]
MPKKQSTVYISSKAPKNTSDNRIINTKYSILSFPFMMAKMQIESISSTFFLFVIFCQIKKTYRITSLYSSLLPWLVIFMITVLREAIDNYSRYLRDKEINMAQYKKLKGKDFAKVESQKIKVGDIILIEKGQRVPADCILLKSEDNSGEIFIRTDQLDGETDWKRRNSLAETQHCAIKSLSSIEAEIEPPSKEIYSFNGKLIVNSFIEKREDNQLIFGKPSSPIRTSKSVDLENISLMANEANLLNIQGAESAATPEKIPVKTEAQPVEPARREMGCDLENTLWANTVVSSSAALALVIYTGHDTRSMMNTNKPRNKTGIIEKELDRFVAIMAVISIFGSIMFTFFRAGFDFSTSWRIVCVRFIIIFSYVIPISLRFMITTARFIYAYRLSKDPSLSTVKVLTNTLQEELARISFFLTDKTGTLTKNEMIMRKLHIGTVCYNAENTEEITRSIGKILDKSWRSKKMFWKKSKSLDSKIYDLIEALSVCHSVMPIESEEGIQYQASSPDEVAMVNYTGQVGMKLVARDNHKMHIQNPKGEIVTYEILYTFPFNSDTKRMGIILKKDDEYIFFEKGADTVMKSIVKENDWIEEETDNMAREGLRTLVIAKKVISESEFSKFAKAYNTAKMSLVNRNEKMLEEQCKLEKDLDVVGLTGVEDKLQDKVKQTLESLRNAGIKIWMLTGDKIETAISIAFSSRLLTKNDHYMIIANCTSKDEIKKNLDALSTRGFNSLVVDGASLAVIIDHFLDRFIDISKGLHCLVGCRYTPTQKAIMAAALREKANETVLCIGDGGNDVSMITQANVGVGIEGKEGSQASLAADFALKSFSDVLDLLLSHGRMCYKNTSKIAHLIFHRGVLLSTIQAIFCCLIHFFPISILQGKMPMLFILFTIFPLFWVIIDQDIPKSLSMQYPELFKELQLNNLLSIRQFFISLTMSIFQASTFILLYFKLKKREMFSLSTICFTNLIINEQLMVLLSVSENLNRKNSSYLSWLYRLLHYFNPISFGNTKV